MTSTQALLQQAVQYHKAGQLKEAQALYGRILTIDPQMVTASLNLGVIYVAQGRVEQAAAAFEQVIEQDPVNRSAWSNLTKLWYQTQQWSAARECCRQVIAGAHPPRDIQALWQRLQQWVHCQGYEPMTVDQAHHRARNHQTAREWELAAHLYEAILAIQPHHTPSLLNYGLVLIDQARYSEALVVLNRALELTPNSSRALSALGLAHQQLNRFDLAQIYHIRALNLDPHNSRYYLTLGALYYRQGSFDLVLHYFRQGLLRDPNHNLIRLNLGLTLLTIGDLEQGFPYYASRFKAWSIRRLQKVQNTITQWQNQPIQGHHCLLWCEQGLGDTIQFSRYVPQMLHLAGTVTLAVRPPLLPLFQQLFEYQSDPNLTIISEMDVKDPDPIFDFHCSLLDLPHRFSTTFQAIPAPVPYFRTPSQWPPELQIPSTGFFRLGCCWASTPSNKWLYTAKSIPAAQILPGLLKHQAVQVIDLQVGSDHQQLDPWRSHPHVIEMGTRLRHFADTAAVIAQLDLVITVDTAVAHLAAAMGKPTWILLPYVADWRWFLDRQDTPWYPTARLFRQQQLDDWTEVVQSIDDHLQAVLEGASPLFTVECTESEKGRELRALGRQDPVIV